MSWKENFTIELFGAEIELELSVNPAEHDVGIMGNWIDDWNVTAVDGSTSRSRCDEAISLIEEEFGDEKFIEYLYEQGAAENPEFDDYD